MNNEITIIDKFEKFEKNLSLTTSDELDIIKMKVQKHYYWHILNPQRGTIIVGMAGSGKSYSTIKPLTNQFIAQGRCIFNFDVKFNELTLNAYNAYLLAKKNNPKDNRSFSCIYPNDIRYSHKSNPIGIDIADKKELLEQYLTAVLYNLNKKWAESQGEFFSDSAIAICTGIGWLLHWEEKRRGEKVCTLPHITEFLTFENEDMMFAVLMEEEKCKTIIASVAQGYMSGATDQKAGQMSSLINAMRKLVDKNLYYILQDSNTNLDVNNPDRPNILNLGGAINTQEVYSPIMALYATVAKTIINKPNMLPSAYIVSCNPLISFLIFLFHYYL
mgnify:CR=1 FL=1